MRWQQPWQNGGEKALARPRYEACFRTLSAGFPRAFRKCSWNDGYVTIMSDRRRTAISIRFTGGRLRLQVRPCGNATTSGAVPVSMRECGRIFDFFEMTKDVGRLAH